MADNIDVTPGTGRTVATDDVGGIQFQKVKLDVGGDGASAPLSPTDTLPATLYSGGTEIDFTAPVEVLGTGAAGTPATGVVTVQGIASMTPVQVSQATAANLNTTASQGGAWNITNISGAISLPTGAATEASLVKIPLAQGSTTSGQSGALIQGAVTTAAPTYTTAQTSPLSLTTGGALRVDVSGVSTAANQASVIGTKAAGTAATNSVLVGGIYNSTPVSMSNGFQAALQMESNGAIKASMYAGGAQIGSQIPQDGQFPSAPGIYTYSIGGLASAASQFFQMHRTVNFAANQPGTGVAAAGLALFSVSDLTQFRINVAASGDTALVSASSSQTTRVYRMRLTAPTAITVQIKDGSTILEVIDLVPGVPYILGLSDRPYYKTTANTVLNINLSAATQVNGMLEYVKS